MSIILYTVLDSGNGFCQKSFNFKTHIKNCYLPHLIFTTDKSLGDFQVTPETIIGMLWSDCKVAILHSSRFSFPQCRLDQTLYLYNHDRLDKK